MWTKRLAQVSSVLLVGAAVAVPVYLVRGNSNASSPDRSVAAAMDGASTAPSAPTTPSDMPTPSGGAEPDAEVRAAVIRAIRAHQEAVAPSQTGLAANHAPSAAQLSTQQSVGLSAIGSIFTAAQANKETRALDNVLSAERSGQVRMLGGGVTKVTFQSVAVDGSSATVEAIADVFSNFSARQPDGSWIPAEPHNSLDMRLALTKDASQKWMITDMTWTFVPGTGP